MIITITDIETYLNTTISDGNPSTTSGAEAQWEYIIAGANAKVESICNRNFSAADYTERVNGNGQKYLLLKEYPLNTLTSLNYIDIDENLSEINTDNVVIDNAISELFSPYCFAKGDYNIQAVYNAGYSDEDMPDDLKLTTTKIAVDVFNNVKTNTLKIKEKNGDYSYEISSVIELNNSYKSALDNYIKKDYK